MSSATPSPSKRPRTEGKDNNSDNLVAVQSPDLWLKDGSIIIRTLPKGTHPTKITLFKVHKHLLGLHCSVFATLFDGPQEALEVGSEQYDGLPIMELPDDPDDVVDFLRALYFPEQTNQHTPIVALPFDKRWTAFPPAYSGILRLGTKYDAPSLKKIASAALKAQWPSTLSAWDGIQWRDTASEPSSCSAYIQYLHPDSAKVITLASSCGEYDVLTLAYYNLACYIQAIQTLASQGNPCLSRLSSDHLCKVLLGRAAMNQYMRLAVQNISRPSGSPCQGARKPSSLPLSSQKEFFFSFSTPSPVLSQAATFTTGRCQESACRTWLKNQCISFMYMVDPLSWLLWTRRAFNTDNFIRDYYLCESCHARMVASMSKIRQDFWKRLPSFFGLVRRLLVDFA
ncbi:hypothetical protein FA95DRAFT_987578 [Auriscalpium vulgare]|uniref:Uncharacterized protein n=1 Tax=Auriscalpium vulgare TaxID=40419 RepID=A0ACB8RYB0_9AGAM|nr:hypothetical protein FA95DRAFT_987578 [Auriscalpium vulgare]